MIEDTFWPGSLLNNLQKVHHGSMRGAGAHCWQGGLQGDLCGERPGLPRVGRAGSGRPTAGHSWGPQPHWWHLRESAFKKQQKTPKREEGGTKRRSSRGSAKVRGRGGGTATPRRGRYSPGRAHLGQRKDTRRKMQQRETARLTMDPPPSHPLTPFVALLRRLSTTCSHKKAWRRPEWRSRVEPGKAGKESCGFTVCLFVSYYQISNWIFILNSSKEFLFPQLNLFGQ